MKNKVIKYFNGPRVIEKTCGHCYFNVVKNPPSLFFFYFFVIFYSFSVEILIISLPFSISVFHLFS